MKVAFRVDASTNIGTGHVMRCLTLAKALVEHGAEAAFFCRIQDGSMEGFIESLNYKVFRLTSPDNIIEPLHSEDYAAWLQVSEEDDAQSFLLELDNWNDAIDLIIVDHYGIGKNWETRVKNRSGAKLIAIDDLVRQHEADFIVDQTLNRAVSEYKAIIPQRSKVLCGTEFALLKENFNALREQGEMTPFNQGAVKVLVSMGGGDLPNATEQVLVQLILLKEKSSFIQSVDVVLHPRCRNYLKVKQLVEAHSDWMTLFDFVEDMAGLMARSHIAIGAPGATSWERCCIGLPSVLIPLADNQNDNAKALKSIGAVELVILDEISIELIPAIEKIYASWDKYKINNSKICDGLGVNRILQHLFPICCKDGSPVSLRLATNDDIKLVFEWQSLPETRRYARNNNTPNWDEHQAWMLKCLDCERCYFYIIKKSDQDVGVVRIDRLDALDYEISIYITPAVFGLGVATAAIEVLTKLHRSISITAMVLKENIASHRMFKSAGFSQIDEQTYRLKRVV